MLASQPLSPGVIRGRRLKLLARVKQRDATCWWGRAHAAHARARTRAAARRCQPAHACQGVSLLYSCRRSSVACAVRIPRTGGSAGLALHWRRAAGQVFWLAPPSLRSKHSAYVTVRALDPPLADALCVTAIACVPVVGRRRRRPDGGIRSFCHRDVWRPLDEPWGGLMW